jgi:hypothetical protein
MYFIIDTNVPIVANGKTPQASLQCIRSCVQKLQEIQQKHIVVLDSKWYIVTEYKKKLSDKGQPGVGDVFLKWLLTNQNNSRCCQLVEITPTSDDNFEEFPQDESLSNFERSDRKFVAVAIVHSQHPPIVNATDSDWSNFQEALANYGVKVEFLCPELQK